ncbi:helix-turn-helix transcriptional regulator [Candidatus Thioglobus sp.]|uniref:helix-turn-helix transcriptional regulator n=1 Tax=Candidatus Thioglobus sp. TaxID=2026721 RepID=UPI003D0B6347
MTDREMKLQQVFASSRGMLVQKSYLLAQLDNCSESTLKRTINNLRNKFLVPLKYDRQNHGWRSDKSYTMPGLFFSDNELYAFLVLEQLLENMDEGLVSEQLFVAKEKINRLLASKLKTDIKITDKLRFISIFHRTYNKDIFQTIAKAAFNEAKITIDYYAKNNKKSSRVVSPQRIVHYKNNWYLDAFCHLRKDLRIFSIDGISQVKTLDEPAKIIPTEQINTVVQSSYGIFSGTAKKIAVLNFYPPVAFWIAKEKWHPKQQSKWLKNDILELKIPYNKEQELLADILRYATHVKIISPKSLRQSLVNQATTLLKNNT